MRLGEIEKRLPWILLAALMVASGVLLLSLTAGFTFISDEWDLVLLRPGWGPDTLFAPFHEHIVVAPALIYKLLQSIFGMGSPRPMQVVAIGTFLTTGLLLFVWLRSRVGDWGALIGAAIVLFLGAAFEDLLWAFQLGYFGGLACGLGALIALDRDDRKGDVAATILLVASLSFSSVGMAFVAGAVVECLTNPRDRSRRWFVAAVPVAFYALWWLGWGRDAESDVTLANLPDLPGYIWDAVSAGLTSMLGLATGDGSEPDQPHLIWGRIALLVLAGLTAWRLIRLGRVPRGLLVVGAVGLAFFGLAALGQNELRPPTSSRYQLPAVVFILLFIGELLRGAKIPAPALAVAATVVLITSLSGVDLMREQADTRWKPSVVSSQVSLGAIALGAENARPDYVLDLGSVAVPIERFRDEVEASGSPGYSTDEIGGMDPAYRELADRTLIDVLGLELSGVDPGAPPGACRTVPVAAGTPVPVNPGTTSKIVNLEDRGLTVAASRFGDPPGNPVGSTYPRSWAWLTLPSDDSSRPWQVTLDGRGRINSCG